MNNENDVMTATFRCDRCSLEREVPAGLRGKRAKCPRCGAVCRIAVLAREASEAGPEDGPGANASAGGLSPVAPRREEGILPPLPSSYVPERRPPAAQTRCPLCHQVIVEANPAPVPVPAPSPASPAPAAAPALRGKGPASPAHRSAPPPALVRKPLGRESEKTMRCPYCLEEILLAAHKCKHCGEFLDDTLCAGSRGATRREMVRRASAPAVPRKKVLLVGACLGVLGLAIGVTALLFRGGNGGPTGPAAATPADNEKAPIPNAALEGLVKGLEKNLQGTSTRDATNSVLNFLSSDKGVMPWHCEVRKTSDPRQPVKGLITLPYKLDSADPRIPSTKGRYVLEFAPRGARWELETVLKEAHMLCRGGGESEIPEEDRGSLKQQERDPAVQHLRKAVHRVQASNVE